MSKDLIESSVTGAIRYSKGKPMLAYLSPAVWPKGSMKRAVADYFWRVGPFPSELFLKLDNPELAGAANILVWAATVKTPKYPLHNWGKGLPMSNVASATLRHLVECETVIGLNNPEMLDWESTRQSAWHASCGLMFMAHVAEYYPHLDDRPYELVNVLKTLEAENDGA